MLLLYFYIASNKENNYCCFFFFGHSGTNLCNDRYIKQQQQTNKTKQNVFPDRRKVYSLTILKYTYLTILHNTYGKVMR